MIPKPSKHKNAMLIIFKLFSHTHTQVYICVCTYMYGIYTYVYACIFFFFFTPIQLWVKKG